MATMNVQELVDQVRSQLSEFNSADITDQHVLDALNRAQKAATRITARRLDTIFLATAELTTIGGQREYDMPDDTFGRRIEKVEIFQGSIAWRVKRLSYKDRDSFITSSTVTRPYYYDVIGSQIRFYPKPSAGQRIVLHYSRTPDTMLIPQGQINKIDTANNYIIVDNIGPDITTESDTRESYINFIDYITGDVKGSMQVAFTDAGIGQIKFKSSGITRSPVLGKTISTTIPADVTEDDYVCLVSGTAVPQLPDAYTDYLIQHAVVALKRRTREPTEDEYTALKDIEGELKKMMQGREQYMRIRKTSSHWSRSPGSALRRYFS